MMHSNREVFTCPNSPAISAALRYLDVEGLQAPSVQQLQVIIDAALQATALFSRSAVLEPHDSDIREFFADFIIRCVNRPSGVGDAIAD